MESSLGTAIRTGVVLVMSWMMVFVTGKGAKLREVPKGELGFICLSGLATGGSWLCYYKALQDGMACGGALQVFIEVYGTRPLLVVCGGGHVGTCVLRAAKLTGFELWLFDDRPQEAVAEAAALADRFFPVAGDFYEGIAAQAVSPGAFFVICGHSHTQDGEALHAALGKDAAYVGMLGSRRKIAALFERLRSLGVPQAQLDTVCTPIGFDLGGETPEELAIAILAQILLVKNRGRQALTDAKEDKA